MLQDKDTNYSYIKLAIYVDITKILYENQNYNKNKLKSKKCHQELKFLCVLCLTILLICQLKYWSSGRRSVHS